ncbi:MAG: transcriptional repressor [Dehalococcoidia bacterium]
MSRNLNSKPSTEKHSWTSKRRLLLDVLREAEGQHIDAKELYRRASSIDVSISPATVYRSLNLFKRLNLIDEIRLDRVRCYYEIRQAPEHQHLVCLGCGKVIEFQNSRVRRLIEAVKREQGFSVTKAQLYLEGYCLECQERNKSGSSPVTIRG